MATTTWASVFTIALAAGLASSGSGSATAAEPPSRSLGVAPVAYEGDVPKPTQLDIDGAIDASLARLDAQPLRFDRCRNAPCSMREADGAGVRFVLAVHVSVEDRDYGIEVALHRARDGQVIAQTDELCELCGHSELLTAIEAQITALAPVLDRAQASPQITVAGDPAGAEVILDGVSVGVAPLTLDVELGPHELELRAPGRATQTYPVEATRGVEERIDYALAQASAVGSGRGMRIGGWLSLGLGLGGVGAGATLLALDGRAHRPTCGPSTLDINGACPNVYTTATAGIVTLAASSSALIMGVTLLIVSSRRSKRHARAARLRPTLRPSLGGIGLSF